MVKKFIPFLMAAFMLTLGSCLKDDIEDLQDQIDDLSDKVVLLEAEQEAALLAKVAELQALIAAHELEVNDDLTDLETTVGENKSAIYYGNLISDVEYDEFVAAGASVVTGKVVVSAEGQVAKLALLETVGGNFEIAIGTDVDVPNLKTVVGSVTIEGVKETFEVSLPMLALAGDINISNNSGLTSFTTESLDVVTGDLLIEYKPWSVGTLSTLDLAGADVIGGVVIQGTDGVDVELGTIGALHYNYNMPGALVVTAAEIAGDVTLEWIGSDFTNLAFDNLTAINGSFTLENAELYDGEVGMATGLTTLDNAFEALTAIGGDITIQSNKFLASFDEFNNLESIGLGQTSKCNVNIRIECPTINAFNGVTQVGPVDKGATMNVSVAGKLVTVFDAFTGNDKVDVVLTLAIQKYQDQNYKYHAVSGMDFEGFNAVSELKNLNINASECSDTIVTVQAFEALTTLSTINLNFSVINGEFSFTGLNNLTDAPGTYGSPSALTIKKYHYQSMNVTLDILEKLTAVDYLDLDFQVSPNSSDDLEFELDLVHGLPSTINKGCRYMAGLLNTTNGVDVPMALCHVPAVQELFKAVFVDKTTGTYWSTNMYTRSTKSADKLTASSAPSTDDYLAYLMADECGGGAGI